ncbi:hypothetical protein A6A04_02145 [Paramagnetospirillum marisnigri]|uniref:Uncharacterized protein n=1 Tax=Paramagnetospirillum marisnigri TaxID=1285242 RepID=A0A178MQB2_9PROT|nr:hypothetical protein [Paramagnetospirillum marisnigri]OAN50227.1 hypothetical protein A6A04_02145 [Paramagnetospirillum marisnigri]
MTGADRVRQELEKAASLVGAARRLLATGTMVDLAALEGKVKGICRGVIDLGLEDGRMLRPDMEALLADLDLLAADIKDRYDPAAPPMDTSPEH